MPDPETVLAHHQHMCARLKMRVPIAYQSKG